MKLDGEDVSGVYDVIVVGAGIIGSCTAYELAKRGKSVLLLEQFDFLHRRGSSHGSSRTIRITYPEEYYTEMMLEAYELWRKVQEDSGYAVFTRTGQIDFGPRENNASLASVVTSLQKFSVEHQTLTSAQACERFPMLSLPEDWYVVYTSHGGILHASKAVAMFQSLAAKYGATLRDRARVLEITSSSSTSLEKAMEGVSVSTSRGKAIGQRLILAAGSWTGKLVKQITGVELPITPLHTALTYWEVEESERDLFSQENGFPVFNCYNVPYIYGTPSIEYPGIIKVGIHAGTPCDPETRSVVPDLQMHKEIVSPWVAKVFKGKVKHDSPVLAEGCVYSMTPDEDFILDFLPSFPNILVAAGFSGHGFKMAPVVARIMADLAFTGAASPAHWMQHFRFQRFQENPKGNRKDFEAQVVAPHGVKERELGTRGELYTVVQ